MQAGRKLLTYSYYILTGLDNCQITCTGKMIQDDPEIDKSFF